MEFIASLQPYNGSDGIARSLWLLNTLWNMDKHRVPVLAAMPVNIGTVRAEGDYDMFMSASAFMFKDRAAVGVLIPSNVPSPNVAIHIAFHLRVVLMVCGPGGGEDAQVLLGRCIENVRTVVTLAETWLA
jgi:hypothetical protein